MTERGPAADGAALRRRLAERGVSPRSPLESVKVDELCVMYSFACDLRCDYCWLWGKTGAVWDPKLYRDFKEELPLEALFEVIDGLIAFSPGLLNLSGGEPLMTSTWLPLARRAREHGIPVSITTSGGVHLKKNIPALLETVDQVNLSLNGPPSIAAKVRPGPAGHYRDMLVGLKALTNAKRRAGLKTPKLRVLSTVSDTNYAHVTEMMRFLKKADIDVDQYYLQLLIYNDATTLGAQAAVHREEFGEPLRLLKAFTYSPRDMDFDVLHKELELARTLHPDVKISADLDRAGLEDYYTGRKKNVKPSYCMAPWTEISLLPNGDLFCCPDLPIGNILTSSFADIWNGAKARKIRARVQERLFPACAGCFHFYSDRESNRVSGVEARP